jgi:hypothetical protein
MFQGLSVDIFLYIFLSEQTTCPYSHATEFSPPLSLYLLKITILSSLHLDGKYSNKSRKTTYDTEHYFQKAY